MKYIHAELEVVDIADTLVLILVNVTPIFGVQIEAYPSRHLDSIRA